MTDDGAERWDGYLGPRVWVPVAVVLVALAAFFAAAFAMRDGDSEAAADDVQLGEAGSTLRQGVHWHADFAVHVRGEAYDFEGAEFLSTEERELSEAVHIHDPRHNVVHIHLSSSTWGEFFQSLDVDLRDDCVTFPDGEELCNTDEERWTFLVNGAAIDSARFHYIGDLERFVASYGPESAEELADDWQERVGDEACIPSGACSERFPPGGIEEEPCSVGSTTCN